jgi:hypothetical protein
MSLTDSGSNLIMPVAPTGGGFGGGFGGGWGDGIWLILLVLFAIGGNGFGFGGFGGGGLAADGAMLYPWMNQANQTAEGFQNQLMNDNITSIRDGVQGLSTQLCNTGSTIQMALANGFTGVEQGANARQMADMQQMFALQSSLQNCCCENRLGIANLGSDIAREACATRTNDTQNTQSILNVINGGIQSIKDQLCSDKIDAKNEKIADLERQLSMATLRESQVAQNAFIAQGFANEVDQLYNRLSSCPVPSTPVYGRTPIFSCNGGGCGCSGNAFYN